MSGAGRGAADALKAARGKARCRLTHGKARQWPDAR
ncbi:Protein of unknown function [Thermobacillus xylanilyticus]|uniref:Uncharacterized protein n=1 Tax=Thermobacillus xylanilyticus TaxID=76633 RepID=A0ABN7S7Y4_THEXY|nr:Protein of unknown function [Thermobacillus xylanilyticus]